ncbi:DUF5107 domain-containing protein, partial [Streptomyces sp. NPDC057557]
VAAEEGGQRDRAADLYTEAFDDLCAERRDDGDVWTSATAALGREAMEALLAAGRPEAARTVWAGLCAAVRQRGRFRLLEARLLIAEGDRAAARAVFSEGFEVADLREGAEILDEVWAELADEPLPDRYNFRMGPRT